MTNQEIANQLVNYCKQGQWEKAHNELYSAEAVSIEPKGVPFPELTTGLVAIKAKGEHWAASVETFHGMEIDGPLVAGDYFSCTMKMDVTFKGVGRKQDEELCIYKVENGKIVSEQFFYPVGE